MANNLPVEANRHETPLSPRELQLLSYAAQGHTDKSIANLLGISLPTVGTYWGRIRIKLGPLNRTELVARWLQEQANDTMTVLRDDNRRLLQQLEEHSKVEAMLKTSLEMFRGLIETAPDAILVVNEDGAIVIANEQAEELFGYHKDELLGLSVEALVPEQYRSAHVTNRNAYNHNPVRRQMGEHMATQAVHKDGTIFPMATALSATQSPGGLLITCIVRDLRPHLDTVSQGKP